MVNKKIGVYSFIVLLVLVGAYFVSSITLNADDAWMNATGEDTATGMVVDKWTLNGNWEFFNFTINNTNATADIINISLTLPSQYTLGCIPDALACLDVMNTSLAGTDADQTMINFSIYNISNFILINVSESTEYYNFTYGQVLVFWINATASGTHVSEGTGISWTVSVEDNETQITTFTMGTTYIDVSAPNITEVNVTDGTHWLIDNETTTYMNLNSTSNYLLGNVNITVWAVITDVNLNTSGFNDSLGSDGGPIIFFTTNGSDPETNTNNMYNVSMTYVGTGSSNDHLYFASLLDANGVATAELNDTNITRFIIFANDTYGQSQIQNGLLDSNVAYNFTLDGTAPETPTVTAPAATSITSRHSISYKCSSGDITSGVNKITWLLTKPQGSTVEYNDNGGETTRAFTGDDTQVLGGYSVKCKATDNIDLVSAWSTSYTFTVRANPSGAEEGGGGAGGGGAVVTYDVDFSTQNEKQFTKSVGSSVTFTFDGATKHILKIDEISDSEVTLTISSTPQTVTLKVGESKEIDLNKDGLYDLTVNLNSISSGKADITVKKLEVGAKEIASEEKEAAKEAEKGITPVSVEEKAGLTWVWILVIIIIIVILWAVFKKKKKR